MSKEYIPFPKNPEKVRFLDLEVYKYVSPEEMDKHVLALSARNRLTDYDAVLVNLWGGWQLFNDLRTLQGYRKWPYQCIFHRSDNENGTIPVDNFLRNKKVLIVDDSLEGGQTLRRIFNHVGPESRAVVAMALDGVRGQIIDPRIDVAVFVDNLPVGGRGKNIGIKGEGQIIRQYGGIVAKI